MNIIITIVPILYENKLNYSKYSAYIVLGYVALHHATTKHLKLITTPTALETEFTRLIQEYNEFYWATAWAGINSKAFDALKVNNRKIKKIIVGIHFYQTHPDFIESFLTNGNMRFILQPAGTFHPKLYLFTN